jgi:hypothetical protein
MVKTSRDSFLKVKEVQDDLDAISLLGEKGLTPNQIADSIEKIVELEASASEINNNITENGTKFVFPAEWEGYSPDIYKRVDGKYFMQNGSEANFRKSYMIKSTDVKAKGNKIYWVTKSGSDSSDGLSYNTGLASLVAALAKPDVLTIMLEGGGIYGFSTTVKSSVNIIAFNGKATIYGYHSSCQFIADTTYDNVFIGGTTIQMEKPSSARVFDSNGSPLGYTLVESIQEVSETPFSYIIIGKLLYVNASSLPVLGVDIFATLKGWNNNFYAVADDLIDVSCYIENLIFPIGLKALSNNENTNLYNLNCNFNGSFSGDGYLTENVNSISCNPIFAYGENDGASYTHGNIIEINAKAYSNGYDSTKSNQGSTCHLTTNMLRVGGEYESAGQNSILDVGTGKTINLAVECTGRKVAIGIGNATSREMWNYHCKPCGVDTGKHYQNDSSGTMHIIGNNNNLVIGGAGTVILSTI